MQSWTKRTSGVGPRNEPSKLCSNFNNNFRGIESSFIYCGIVCRGSHVLNQSWFIFSLARYTYLPLYRQRRVPVLCAMITIYSCKKSSHLFFLIKFCNIYNLLRVIFNQAFSFFTFFIRLLPFHCLLFFWYCSCNSSKYAKYFILFTLVTSLAMHNAMNTVTNLRWELSCHVTFFQFSIALFFKFLIFVLIALHCS